MIPHISAANPAVIQEFNGGTCPKCLGLCSCRGCMRKQPKVDLAPFPPAQLDEYARHILNSSGPVLRASLAAEDAVVSPFCPAMIQRGMLLARWHRLWQQGFSAPSELPARHLYMFLLTGHAFEATCSCLAPSKAVHIYISTNKRNK